MGKSSQSSDEDLPSPKEAPKEPRKKQKRSRSRDGKKKKSSERKKNNGRSKDLAEGESLSPRSHKSSKHRRSPSSSHPKRSPSRSKAVSESNEQAASASVIPSSSSPNLPLLSVDAPRPSSSASSLTVPPDLLASDDPSSPPSSHRSSESSLSTPRASSKAASPRLPSPSPNRQSPTLESSRVPSPLDAAATPAGPELSTSLSNSLSLSSDTTDSASTLSIFTDSLAFPLSNSVTPVASSSSPRAAEVVPAAQQSSRRVVKGVVRLNVGDMARVITGHQPQNEQEVELLEGQFVQILGPKAQQSRRGKGWLVGWTGKTSGFFPQACVAKLPIKEAQALQQSGTFATLSADEIRRENRRRRIQFPVAKRRAIADYSPRKPHELELKTGAVLSVLEKRPSGWWKGYLADHAHATGEPIIGRFPVNFTTQYVNEPSAPASSSSFSSQVEHSSSAQVAAVVASNSETPALLEGPTSPATSLPRTPRLSSSSQMADDLASNENGRSINDIHALISSSLSLLTNSSVPIQQLVTNTKHLSEGKQAELFDKATAQKHAIQTFKSKTDGLVRDLLPKSN